MQSHGRGGREKQRGMQHADTTVGGTARTEAAHAWQRSDREGRLSWWRHWELWLALALGGLLRLWHADYTTFGDDQAALMTMARHALERHELPVTGIPSSIGSLNPPVSIYVIIPFAAGRTNPLPAVLSLALWNVLGVALCYIFALRFFGRRIATVGTLLFA